MKTQETAPFRSDFLASLTPGAKKKLLALSESRLVRAGQHIFRQDDPALNLYLVTSGSISIEIHVPTRGSQRIVTTGPGEVFSWSAVLEPHVETATARAIDDSEILVIPGKAILDLCHKDCPFSTEIYRALAVLVSSRLRATRLQLLDIFASP